MPKIKQAKILIVATDGFEQSELLVPQEKLSDAGATVEVAAPKSRQKSGKIYGWNKDDWGKSVSVDKDLDEVNVADYDALVLPGGQINPDKLRLEPKAIEIIRLLPTPSLARVSGVKSAGYVNIEPLPR
jgi:protease I